MNVGFTIYEIQSKPLRRLATVAFIPVATVWALGIIMYEGAKDFYQEVVPEIKKCWNKE